MSSPSRRFHRRRFLQGTAATGSALFAPTIIPRSALATSGRPGANDRVAIGFIGLGSRARDIISVMPTTGQIVAVCDCYRRRIDECLKRFDNPKWNTYDSYHEMFDAEKLDGVVVPTGAHQRILTCIHACQAGVDVYAEKPLSLYIAEGRALVHAVRRYKRVCQVGSQQRSLPINRHLCEMVPRGHIGEVRSVIACNYPSWFRCYEGLPVEPVPSGLDWDVWSNQAPLHPYNRELHLWRDQWRCYHGGEVTNMGPHGLDMIQCALGMDGTGPVEIEPLTEGYSGPWQETPLVMRYANGIDVRLERDWATRNCLDEGGIFLGSQCKLEILRDRYRSNPPDFVKDAPQPVYTGPGNSWVHCSVPHLNNWFDCVKLRKRPNADVEIGHRSATLCHLVNIAREVGRKIHWDPDREECVGDEQANALVRRARRAGYELPHPA